MNVNIDIGRYIDRSVVCHFHDNDDDLYLHSDSESHDPVRYASARGSPGSEQGRVVDIAGFLTEKFNFTKISVW